MSLPHPLPFFTPEEYLSLERLSELRHEYLDGSVYAMAGESVAHSTICFNLAVAAGSRLRGTPCRGFSPNMKVRAGEGGLYAYPDLTIVCGEPAFADARADVLTNPTVIFEVLSPSTEAYDRGEKFSRYRAQVESLRDYVLIAQDKPRAERHTRRDDGSWEAGVAEGLGGVLELPSAGCRLPLAEIYERVEFGAARPADTAPKEL
jgi:Uma2 family endonuclease